MYYKKLIGRTDGSPYLSSNNVKTYFSAEQNTLLIQSFATAMLDLLPWILLSSGSAYDTDTYPGMS